MRLVEAPEAVVADGLKTGTAAAASTRSDLKDALVMTGNGTVLQMFNHGITSAPLFMLGGVIYERARTRDLGRIGGLAVVAPVYGGMLIFSALASLGLPGLNGFVGEFLVFWGAWPAFTLTTAQAALGMWFTEAHPLWMIRRVLRGPSKSRWAGLGEIGFREGVAVIHGAHRFLEGLDPGGR